MTYALGKRSLERLVGVHPDLVRVVKRAIELTDHGSLYRIVSFIGVGILLLIVGYFAPVPAKTLSLTDDDPETPRKEQT